MAMGKDKIKSIFVKPLVKTTWVIEEATCRPSRFQKMAFKILKDIVPQQYKMYKTSGIKNIEKSISPKNCRFGF